MQLDQELQAYFDKSSEDSSDAPEPRGADDLRRTFKYIERHLRLGAVAEKVIYLDYEYFHALVVLRKLSWHLNFSAEEKENTDQFIAALELKVTGIGSVTEGEFHYMQEFLRVIEEMTYSRRSAGLVAAFRVEYGLE